MTATRLFALAASFLTLASIAGQSAPRLLHPRTEAHLPFTSEHVLSSVLGDVDGDGDVDLVFGLNTRALVYFNDGKAAFTREPAWRLPATGFRATSLALGDLDGDGDLDLVLGNLGSGGGGTNHLFLNKNGWGVFEDKTTGHLPPVRDYTNAVALGDIDGDGDLDLVVGNSGAVGKAFNRLYLNDGKAVFKDASANLPADSNYSYGLALADLDGDGDLDLAVGNATGNTSLGAGQTQVYLNDGKGVFAHAPAGSVPVDADGTLAIATADVDGDGDLDLVLGNTQQNRLYRNDGKARFTDVTATALPSATRRTYVATLADLDGDGDPDLLFGNGGYAGNDLRSNQLLLNDGKGVFTIASSARLPAIGMHTRTLAVGDLDGDRDLDLIEGNQSEQSHLFLNDGKGRFAAGTRPSMPPLTEFMAGAELGDVDGDGDLDLVIGNAARCRSSSCTLTRNMLFLNDGKGNFSDASTTALPQIKISTLDPELADVDGDGDLDLLLGNHGGGYYMGPIWVEVGLQNRLYRNNGQGRFKEVTSLALPGGKEATYVLDVADLDGDGDLDFLTGNYGRNRLFLNSGKGTFTDVTQTHLPYLRGGETALGDIDGDGDPDYLLFHGADRVLLNDGKAVFKDATKGRFPVTITNALLADLDGDADLDLLAYRARDRFRLLLNDGKGFFTDATSGRLPLIKQGMPAIGDLDADGDPDIYIDGGHALLNNGKGTFTEVAGAVTPFTARPTNDIVLGDTDGDGDLDLVALQSDEPAILAMNLTRQIHTPLLPRLGFPFRIDLHAWAPGASPTVITFLAAAQMRTPLPPLGVFGLDAGNMVTLPALKIPPSTAMISIVLQVPNDAGLLGGHLFLQALVVRDMQRPLQTSKLTNVEAETVRRL